MPAPAITPKINKCDKRCGRNYIIVVPVVGRLEAMSRRERERARVEIRACDSARRDKHPFMDFPAQNGCVRECWLAPPNTHTLQQLFFPPLISQAQLTQHLAHFAKTHSKTKQNLKFQIFSYWSFWEHLLPRRVKLKIN